MFKKLVAALLLALAMAVVPQSGTVAEAASVYVGTYADDGSRAYLLTHTINIFNRRPLNFSCTVEATGDYLNYHFFSRGGEPYYRNDAGYEAAVYGGQSPVAANIYRFVRDNY